MHNLRLERQVEVRFVCFGCEWYRLMPCIISYEIIEGRDVFSFLYHRSAVVVENVNE